MRTIEWKDGVVVTVDQTKLPNELVFLKMEKCSDVASAIDNMKLRGAPLIGVAAAYGLALTAFHSKAKKREDLMKEIEESAEILRKTRPTAVNLFWAINRIVKKARETSGDAKALAKAVIEEAQKMADEDVEVNRKIGENGSKLIEDGDVILTHCNAGALATGGIGTALAPIYLAAERGRRAEPGCRPARQGRAERGLCDCGVGGHVRFGGRWRDRRSVRLVGVRAWRLERRRGGRCDCRQSHGPYGFQCSFGDRVGRGLRVFLRAAANSGNLS